jgi:predicted nucleic acid-binding protein
VARVFLDTNLLVGRIDPGDPDKRARVGAVLDDPGHTFVVSTQVLLELYAVATRKLVPPLAPASARELVGQIALLDVVPADASLVLGALATAEACQLSGWDAMILEAAAQSGCTELWAEDLATGATLRGVRIVNPLAD